MWDQSWPESFFLRSSVIHPCGGLSHFARTLFHFIWGKVRFFFGFLWILSLGVSKLSTVETEDLRLGVVELHFAPSVIPYLPVTLILLYRWCQNCLVQAFFRSTLAQFIGTLVLDTTHTSVAIRPHVRFQFHLSLSSFGELIQLVVTLVLPWRPRHSISVLSEVDLVLILGFNVRWRL
jgi:hypothetical protein